MVFRDKHLPRRDMAGGKGSYWIVISHYCMNIPKAAQLALSPLSNLS